MAFYCVSYDLNNPGQNYPKVDKYLKELGGARALETVWFVKTDATAAQIRDKLVTLTDKNDKIVVVSAVAPAAWNNLGEQWDKWLLENLK